MVLPRSSVRACLVLVMVPACTRAPPSPGPPTPSASASAMAAGGQPDARPAPEATPSALHMAIPGVLALACEAECSDELANLTVYRDAQGEIGVVTVQGSSQRCSHPPLRYFGPDGVQRAAIPLVPVTPGSPEATRYAGVHEKQTARLRKAETMHCRDVKH